MESGDGGEGGETSSALSARATRHQVLHVHRSSLGPTHPVAADAERPTASLCPVRETQTQGPHAQTAESANKEPEVERGQTVAALLREGQVEPREEVFVQPVELGARFIVGTAIGLESVPEELIWDESGSCVRIVVRVVVRVVSGRSFGSLE